MKIGNNKEATVHEICLNGYQTQDFLASGGYGAVYQVCDLKGDCNYVMKIQESSNLKKRMKVGEGSQYD